MPLNKKAFTLPTQGYQSRTNRPSSSSTAYLTTPTTSSHNHHQPQEQQQQQQRYSQHSGSTNHNKFQREGYARQGYQDIMATIEDLPNQNSSKTMYTRRQQLDSILVNGNAGKHERSPKRAARSQSITASNSNQQNKRRSVTELEYDNPPTTSRSRPQSSSNNNDELLNSSLNSSRGMELAYLHSEEDNVKRVSNPLNEFTKNRYDDDVVEENTRRVENRRESPPLHRNWYDRNGEEEQHPKYGGGGRNSNLDIVSLHSMVSRKSVKRDEPQGWMMHLSYSFVGLLLWTFIIVCIEETDGTVGLKVCNPNQEIRYWASYVCLVAIVTAVTIYFRRENVTRTLATFMLNTVTLMTVHHVPLTCIHNNKLDDRGMGRLRGGLILFVILTLVVIWLFKQYLASKKALPWSRRE